MKKPPHVFIKAINELRSYDKNYPPYSHSRVKDSISAYGLESMIARQSNLLIKPRSFAFWIHGWVWGKIDSVQDLLATNLDRSFNVLVRNDIEKKVFLDDGYRDVFTVGLPYLYTPEVTSQRQPGSLLVFPPHSTNDGKSDFNKDFFDYLDYIKDLEKDFSHVGISIYGLDYQQDLLDKIQKYNFEIVPGAHWTDQNSLIRLKYNLQKYEFSTCNHIGSHMIYALYSGQKFSFTGNFIETDLEQSLERIAIENPYWTQQSISNALERYSLSFISNEYGKFFKDNPVQGIEDIELGKQEIGFISKRSLDEIRYLLGWGINAQIYGVSKKLLNKAIPSKNLSKQKNITKKYQKNNLAKNVIVFVDTIAHLKRSLQVAKEFDDVSYIFISNNFQVIDSVGMYEKYFFESRLSLFFLAIKFRYKKFNLLTARVDDINFQLFELLSQPDSLFTIDEGLFTIKSNSIYNSKNFMLEFYGYKSKIFHSIIGFPRNASLFYEITEKHYSWFSKKSFDSSIINSSKIIEMKSQDTTNKVRSIFIGQPWKYMDFSNQQILEIFQAINKVNPSIYMLHPREDISLCQKYLSEKITLLRAFKDSETFCNSIGIDRNISVYTVASTVATELIKSIKIKILQSSKFPLQTIQSQDTLLKELENRQISYESINIDIN